MIALNYTRIFFLYKTHHLESNSVIGVRIPFSCAASKVTKIPKKRRETNWKSERNTGDLKLILNDQLALKAMKTSLATSTSVLICRLEGFDAGLSALLSNPASVHSI